MSTKLYLIFSAKVGRRHLETFRKILLIHKLFNRLTLMPTMGRQYSHMGKRTLVKTLYLDVKTELLSF